MIRGILKSVFDLLPQAFDVADHSRQEARRPERGRTSATETRSVTSTL